MRLGGTSSYKLQHPCSLCPHYATLLQDPPFTGVLQAAWRECGVHRGSLHHDWHPCVDSAGSQTRDKGHLMASSQTQAPRCLCCLSDVQVQEQASVRAWPAEVSAREEREAKWEWEESGCSAGPIVSKRLIATDTKPLSSQAHACHIRSLATEAQPRCEQS